jgi:hypothetical protein
MNRRPCVRDDQVVGGMVRRAFIRQDDAVHVPRRRRRTTRGVEMVRARLAPIRMPCLQLQTKPSANCAVLAGAARRARSS